MQDQRHRPRLRSCSHTVSDICRVHISFFDFSVLCSEVRVIPPADQFLSFSPYLLGPTADLNFIAKFLSLFSHDLCAIQLVNRRQRNITHLGASATAAEDKVVSRRRKNRPIVIQNVAETCDVCFCVHPVARPALALFHKQPRYISRRAHRTGFDVFQFVRNNVDGNNCVASDYHAWYGNALINRMHAQLSMSNGVQLSLQDCSVQRPIGEVSAKRCRPRARRVEK